MDVEKKLIQIENLLKKNFPNSKLSLEDESMQHTVPTGHLTHIKIILISDKFININRVKRHQHVYNILNDNLDFKLHAIALHLLTNAEWEKNSNKQFDSPNCARNKK